jgi:two-component system LytT family response regulator
MVKPMRTLIVDDESLARAYLVEQLGGVAGIEVVGQAANGVEAIKMVEQLAPDLMLLDIQMPKLTGFDVLDLLGDKAPAVIFITAYDEYAVKAFEVHAVDYLLKPVEATRLAAAIDHARQRFEDKGAKPQPSAQTLAAAARPPGRMLERVVIRNEGQVQVLQIDSIDYIQAQDDYLSFVVGKTKHRKQQTMSELEAQLDASRFVRVHRSFLLNIDRLAKLELYSKDSWLAVLKDGMQIPVSRSGYARIKELIQ